MNAPAFELSVERHIEAPPAPVMVGLFEFAPEGHGTRYPAASLNGGEATLRQPHERVLDEGRTVVTAQLAALVERAPRVA